VRAARAVGPRGRPRVGRAARRAPEAGPVPERGAVVDGGGAAVGIRVAASPVERGDGVAVGAFAAFDRPAPEQGVAAKAESGRAAKCNEWCNFARRVPGGELADLAGGGGAPRGRCGAWVADALGAADGSDAGCAAGGVVAARGEASGGGRDALSVGGRAAVSPIEVDGATVDRERSIAGGEVGAVRAGGPFGCGARVRGRRVMRRCLDCGALGGASRCGPCAVRFAARRGPSGWDRQRRADAVLARGGHRCASCGGEATVVDHIIPLFRGGGDEEGNMQPLCGPCHRAKTLRDRGGEGEKSVRTSASGTRARDLLRTQDRREI
jgi:hypothetical protein